jgi:hypothetical protein
VAHTLRRPRVAALAAAPSGRDGPRRFRATAFTVAYALLVLALAGVGTAAYLVATRPAAHTRPTAALAPAQAAGLGTYALKLVAFDVQQEYRLPNGTPLVAVVARPSAPPQFVSPSGPVAISAMIVHPGFAIEDPRDTKAYDVSKAGLFVLCGALAGCTIPGRPTTARAVLLDREVLELTLRTLERLQSLDSVLTFVPPASAKRVVYLTRGDLARQLSEPLAAALPPLAAGAPGRLRSERSLLTVVGAHTFTVHAISPLPDGSAYLDATPTS